jgi:hypothetical protein
MNYIENIASQIRDEVPTATLPEEPDEELFLLYAVLALTIGERVGRRDVHNAWAAWMTRIDRDHESITPYTELPQDVREEDDPFVQAIRSVSRRLRR